jgi:hypothetical protein
VGQTFAIVSPKEGESVGRSATISGVAPQAGAKVALSVYPQGDIWYPQGVTTVGADGSWSFECRFGNENTPSGWKFTVRAELKDANGQVVATKEVIVQRK